MAYYYRNGSGLIQFGQNECMQTQEKLRGPKMVKARDKNNSFRMVGSRGRRQSKGISHDAIFTRKLLYSQFTPSQAILELYKHTFHLHLECTNYSALKDDNATKFMYYIITMDYFILTVYVHNLRKVKMPYFDWLTLVCISLLRYIPESTLDMLQYQCLE